MPDDPLAALVADYYATYIAHDAAANARKTAWGEAMKLDREATCADVSPLVPDIVQLGSVFEEAGTLPAATQAGMFAKLQATVRFMDDLEVDELYEAEWNAIKADVRRIAGEARST